MTPKTSNRKVVSFLRREPLVHFLLGAGILFMLQVFFAPDPREKVLISKTSFDYLVEQEESLRLRPLTERERQDVIDLLIEEELIVREARKLGFENTSRIRKLLIQNMQVFLAKDVPEVKEADLRAYFAANPDEFRIPDRYSINHVSFKDPPETLDAVFEQLKNGADPATLGDKVPWLEAAIRGRSAGQLSVMFGPDIARAITGREDGAWFGPLRSNYGVHFLQVTERRTGRQMQYDELAGSIRPLVVNAAVKQRIRRFVDGIKGTYNVILEESVFATGDAQ